MKPLPLMLRRIRSPNRAKSPDFVRKRLGIVVQDGDTRLLIVKGALDSVLNVCTLVQEMSGTP